MVRRVKYIALFFFLIAPKSLASEWNFSPVLSIEAIHSDNVSLSSTSAESSWVNKNNLSVNSQFNSKAAILDLTGKVTYARFSHNSSLNENFTELDANGSVNLWNSGAKLLASSSIGNESQNGGQNSLADITSRDTVQVNNNSLGIEYSINNSSVSFKSSYIVNQIETGDNIGESNRYTTSVQTSNSSSARHIFWQINSYSNKSTNQNSSGKVEQHQAKLGWINTTDIIPLINYYSESASGTISSTSNEITSWGPGIMWRITSELEVELSYNYVGDSTKSENYVATAIKWQPSSRTSLSATHSQRFFGDSYTFNFSHQLRRLTNSITYTDSISAFDRSNGIQLLGYYWCPAAIDDLTEVEIEQCVLSSSNASDYTLQSFINTNTETVNEFSLNKSLRWQSTLALSRTTFSFSLTGTSNEYLTSQQKTEAINASFTADRKMSAKSTLTLSTSFRQNKTSLNNGELAIQQDDYLVSSIKYSKRFGHSLTADINIDYTTRDSSNAEFIYNETRASFNIKKDF